MVGLASRGLATIDQTKLNEQEMEYYGAAASFISDSRAAMQEKDYSEARALAAKALKLCSQLTSKLNH